jgi:hypothetical protein
MTIPWLETTPTAQSTMTTPLRTAQETMLPSKTRGKGEAPTANREGGQVAAKALNTSPPPTTNGVDRLYHQLAEIHTIAATQLAECTRWPSSDSTLSPVRARTDW